MSVEQSSITIPNIRTPKNIALITIIILSFALAFYAKGLPIEEVGLIGLLPIFALALLTVIGLDIVLAVIIAIIISVIMTSTSVFELGGILAKSTGSFIAAVGLIIMLGAGLVKSPTEQVQRKNWSNLLSIKLGFQVFLASNLAS